MTEPFELPVAEASEKIKAGELSPVALTEALFKRIEALEPSLKAWVTLDKEGALEAARRSQQELEKGNRLGPLHGIPVGIKDVIYTAGLKTTGCSEVFADFVPDYDATVVARLKEAGAIILGKAVTTELAFADPSPTINPWNPAHTPGGSSSGSGVAVATRMCPAALGTQTVGSTLRPAAYNGVVGLKPTYGRLSRYGVLPVSWSLDTVGIIVRTVEDAAILLSAMAGYDPNDPSSVREPVPDYRAAVKGAGAPPSIGLVRDFFFEHADEETRQHAEAIAHRLAQAGARIQEVKLPESFAAVAAAHRVMITVEFASVHEELFREHASEYRPRNRGSIETGMLIPAVRYTQAHRVRRAFRRDMEEAIRQVDVLLTPATPAPAPRDLTTTGDPRFQGPWTFCGFPSIAIPSGLSQSGLPLGIQLAAAPFAEERLLAAARWCEATLDVKLTPPVPAGVA